MKNKITKKIFCFIGLVGLIILSPVDTKAKESESGIGFSVSPILPKNQIDKDLGYYYLETIPAEEQIFEVKLSSQKDEKQTIQMFVQDAYTGTTGSLTYGVDGENKFEQDETLTNPTSKIIKPISETIELGAREQKIVSFKISPPDKSYEGVKVGRLVFKAVDENNSKDSTAVVEDYQYGVSIILSENGDDFNDGDIQEIALEDVKATVKRGKRLVTANLQNPQSKRVLNLDLLATVTKKGDKKIIKETKIPDFQFAPNTNVDLEINWGLSELEAGEYTVNISAKNDYDKLHLTKEFRITSDVAKQLNRDSAFKIETPIWIKIIAIVSGLLSLTLAIIIFARNNKWLKMVNRKKRNKTKNRKQNKKS